MPYAIPFMCPACHSEMKVTELTCTNCQAKLQGVFDVPGLYRLNRDQMQFVETFLRCRGNIKEVERDLKISYPTVRAKLDQVISALGYTDAEQTSNDKTSDVLDALGNGELSFEEALQRIKGDNVKR